MSGSKKYFDFLSSLENDPLFCYKYLESNSFGYSHPTYQRCLETISKDAKVSLSFAQNILKSRFELAEETISKSAEESLKYASSVIKNRFELGEPAIATNSICSFNYAKYILRGRFELGETAIAQDDDLAYKYATEIIMGQLPEEMHNIMLAKRISA